MNNSFGNRRSGFAACEELMGSFSFDRKVPALVCPKPRRAGVFVGSDSVRSLGALHLSHQTDPCDSKTSADIFDMILSKDNYDEWDERWDEENDELSSFSLPFFCGSPPSRAANPIIHDARFLEHRSSKAPMATPLPFSSSSPPHSGTATVGFFGTTNTFGPTRAMVRVEGFDCLDRDGRRGCSIPAFA